MSLLNHFSIWSIEFWMAVLKQKMEMCHMYGSDLSFYLKHLKFSPRNSNTISDFRAIFLSKIKFIWLSNFASIGSNFSQQVAYILRKVVQVLEQRILTHAGNLRHVILLSIVFNLGWYIILHDKQKLTTVTYLCSKAIFWKLGRRNFSQN